jgi:hypothetical protein
LAAVSLVARREAIDGCRAALAGLRDVLVAGTDKDLIALAGKLAELRALAGAGIAAITAEAETRGLVAASQFASTAAWVADAAWHCRREASTIAKVAALMRDTEYQIVTDAVCAGDIDMPSAVACGQQYANLAPDLAEPAKPVVLEHLLDIAHDHGPAAVRRLADEILARYSDQGSFEEQCERRRRFITLSPGRHTDGGMWDYQLTVDNEGRAILEAAIGPGSAPKHCTITGCGEAPPSAPGGGLGGLQAATRDVRPVGRRRGEALIDALRRSTAYSDHGQPSASPKAVLMLTMKYDDLTIRTTARRRLFGRNGLLDPAGVSHSGNTVSHSGNTVSHSGYAASGSGNAASGFGNAASGGCRREAGHDTHGHAARAPRDARMPGDDGRSGPEIPGAAVVLGSRATGELIDPASARRIACDAGIIPVVLGHHGEVLDQGAMERCFTLAQVRALWRRDQHCTFPGCDIPAAWCDAHHLIHWADGGPTDLSNAALLCARHHTIVHRDQLAGYVSASGPPPAAAHPLGRARRGQTESPAVVTWNLHPDSYRPPGSHHADEQLTA